MKSLLRSGIAVLGLASCYSQPKPFVRMAGSSDVPAAEGKVTATAGDNMNTNLEVNVDHLAPPERVRQGATTYVVWARARGANDYQNVGALLVDNNLHGHLKTVTARGHHAIGLDGSEQFVDGAGAFEQARAVGADRTLSGVRPTRRAGSAPARW